MSIAIMCVILMAGTPFHHFSYQHSRPQLAIMAMK